MHVFASGCNAIWQFLGLYIKNFELKEAHAKYLSNLFRK